MGVREDAAGVGGRQVLISGNRFRRAADQQPFRVSGAVVLIDNRFSDGGALPAR